MKPLYRNVFLAIGVVAIIIMLCTSDLSYSELWDNVRRAGYWFPAVILLWVFLYLANAWSWSVIIHDGWLYEGKGGTESAFSEDL